MFAFILVQISRGVRPLGLGGSAPILFCKTEFPFKLLRRRAAKPDDEAKKGARLRAPLDQCGQQLGTLTARPPSEVSLYFTCMSWPVWRIVSMQASNETRC